LYRVVQENLETLLAEVEAGGVASLRQFVKDEFEAFLECGIHVHGFLRVRCPECGHEKLVAFSWKRRGTSHLVMSPLEFMQRLAALVPRPRLHLIRFHGVLAPHAKLRAVVVPIPAQTTIAAIEEPAVIERILTHLGLSARPPPRTPARRFDLFQAA
jgi:hypothetical protein